MGCLLRAPIGFCSRVPLREFISSYAYDNPAMWSPKLEPVESPSLLLQGFGVKVYRV